MHMAALGGNLEMLKFLAPLFGTRVYEKDSNWFTILHQAASNGLSQVVRYLIEELKIDPKDKSLVCGMPERSCVQHVCACLL